MDEMFGTTQVESTKSFFYSAKPWHAVYLSKKKGKGKLILWSILLLNARLRSMAQKARLENHGRKKCNFKLLDKQREMTAKRTMVIPAKDWCFWVEHEVLYHLTECGFWSFPFHRKTSVSKATKNTCHHAPPQPHSQPRKGSFSKSDSPRLGWRPSCSLWKISNH